MRSLAGAALLAGALAVGLAAGPAGGAAGPATASGAGADDYLFDLKRLAPPRLAYDFYPHGLTRAALRARLTGATRKTGWITANENWSGTIHITGDLWIDEKVTITVAPGTVILVAALSDDQHSGRLAPFDPMNPKKPERTAEYVQSRVEVFLDGKFIARGTRDSPIIISSDAAIPGLDDWMMLQVGLQGTLEFDWVLFEYARTLSTSHYGAITNSIVRNLMESFLVGPACDLADLTIRDNGFVARTYVYNSGQGLQIRWGQFAFTDNVIFIRPDGDRFNFLTYENHGIGNDFSTKIRVERNYIQAGARTPYQGEVMGRYVEDVYPTLLTLFGHDASGHVVKNNTFYYPDYNPVDEEFALNVFPGGLTFADNNVLVHRSNLVARIFAPQTFFEWESPCWYEAAKSFPMTAVPLFNPVTTYWGSDDPTYLNSPPRPKWSTRLKREYEVTVDPSPIRTSLTPAAFPPWREFTWLDVKALPVPPVAWQSAFATGPAGVPLTFDASASSDADGTVEEYFWTFGDGTTGSGRRPTHTYAAAGTYQVGLIVRDNDYAWSANAAYTTAAVGAPGGAPFTDPSLVAGETPVRVVHIQELRTRIDALRARFGLAAFAWTDSPLIAGQTPLRAVHLAESRLALSAAYTAAGRTPPIYSNSTVTAGQTAVLAVHVAELRSAVIALE